MPAMVRIAITAAPSTPSPPRRSSIDLSSAALRGLDGGAASGVFPL
jgi:hypothetical protein